MHEDHVYTIKGQKPNDQMWIKTTQIQKPQKSWVRKFQVKCMKMWINWKRKGKRDLQALEDKNPWRFEAENNKNFRLDRKLALTDRKTNSIDLASIEHRSSQADSILKFYRIFDRMRWSNKILVTINAMTSAFRYTPQTFTVNHILYNTTSSKCLTLTSSKS